MRIPEQWFAYGDDLPVKLAEVLTPGPWKHSLSQNDSDGVTICYCSKCDKQWYFDDFPKRKHCSVPDPIKIDWNTAMGRFRKADAHKSYAALIKVAIAADGTISFPIWLARWARPRHYLIAAAMAVEGAKNE